MKNLKNKFIKLTGRKFKDKILFPVESIGPMWNCVGDKDEFEDPYTVVICNGQAYKVLESKEEIMERIGGVVV